MFFTFQTLKMSSLPLKYPKINAISTSTCLLEREKENVSSNGSEVHMNHCSDILEKEKVKTKTKIPLIQPCQVLIVPLQELLGLKCVQGLVRAQKSPDKNQQQKEENVESLSNSLQDEIDDGGENLRNKVMLPLFLKAKHHRVVIR